METLQVHEGVPFNMVSDLSTIGDPLQKWIYTAHKMG